MELLNIEEGACLELFDIEEGACLENWSSKVDSS